MSKPVISIRGVGKKYRLGATISSDTLRDQIAHAFKLIYNRKSTKFSSNETKRTKNQRRDNSDFWALRDISFDVNQGEVIGIIGRNGAGKSTLLKILSEITEPTSGEIRIRGRVGSLLEVGTGFHPELSGRENIFLNGAILGMTRAEIKDKFDEIVDFAEIDKFLDTPVKRYSSGMYVRLAFAVAAHLEPEILIVDEILAVGDAAFQRKCLGKMQNVSRRGRTVLFVSHNMMAIQNLCTRGILLQCGRVEKDGTVDQVMEEYTSQLTTSDAVINLAAENRFISGPVKCVAMRIMSEGFPVVAVSRNRPFTIEIDVQSELTVKKVTASIDIDSPLGERVTTLYSGFMNTSFDFSAGQTTLSCQVCGLDLRPDDYILNVMLGHDHGQYDFVRAAAVLSVSSDDFYGTGRLPIRAHGPLLCRFEWSKCNGDS